MAIYYQDPLDRSFHALGDGTRRAMLAMLAARGELSAGELGEPFDIAQPTASKHLRVLEQARLVSRRVDGRAHRFRLNSKALAEAEEWIAYHRRFWEGTLESLGEFLKAKRK